MLRISLEQEKALADGTFIRRSVEFLKKEASLAAEQFSDQELRALVIQGIDAGRPIGIKSERELVKWFFLGLLTKGSCYNDEKVLSVLREAGEHPAKVHELLAVLMSQIKSQG